MKKSPPLILLVFILTISIVTLSYANVSDNVLNSSLEQTIGDYDDTATAKTLFGMLQKIVTMLTTMSEQILDIQTMKSDITEVSTRLTKLDNIEAKITTVQSNSDLQTYQTILSLYDSYINSGKESIVEWNSSYTLQEGLATSDLIVNSEYSGAGLDWMLDNGRCDLLEYLHRMSGFTYSGACTTIQQFANDRNALNAILSAQYGYNLLATSLLFRQAFGTSTLLTTINYSGRYNGSSTTPNHIFGRGFITDWSVTPLESNMGSTYVTYYKNNTVRLLSDSWAAGNMPYTGSLYKVVDNFYTAPTTYSTGAQRIAYMTVRGIQF